MDAGTYPNGGIASSIKDMVRFITSKEMKAAFEMGALILFSTTCHLIHGCGHNKQLAKWFVPVLHKWSQTLHCPQFTFDSDGFDNKKRGSTTQNVILNALTGKRGCNKFVSNAENRVFGAYLAVKAWSAEEKKNGEKRKRFNLRYNLELETIPTQSRHTFAWTQIVWLS